MKYHARVKDFERAFEFDRRDGMLRAHRDDGESFAIDVSLTGDGSAFSLIVDGQSFDCLVDREQGCAVVQILGERVVVEIEDERERAAHAVAHARGGGRQVVEASMPGIVVEIKVQEGDTVEAGQTLVVLEAMKMQNPIAADAAGVVSRVAAQTGEAVAGGAVLIELDEPPAP